MARRPLGVYTRGLVLAPPDGRTREGKLLSQTRWALMEHLGGSGKLSAPQRALVERCAMLQLKCALLDEKILNGTFSEYDAKTYLAFSNSLCRSLIALGLKPVAAPEMTL